MYVLGVSTMTDSAAALLRDGELVAACEEERFSRIKHDGSHPDRAIAYVLQSEGITLDDVEEVAYSWDPYNLGHRASYLARTAVEDPGLFLEKMRRAVSIWNGAAGEGSGWGDLFRASERLKGTLGTPRRITFLDHHTTHMAVAYWSTDWDSAAVLIADGTGEAACTTAGTARGPNLDIVHQHKLPDSLGHFYSAITGWLGFKMLSDEYKVMGLAPYGKTTGLQWMREHFLVSSGPGTYVLKPGVLDYHKALRGQFDGAFSRHFGPARPKGSSPDEAAMDVAASAQEAFTEVVIDLARELQRRTGERRLVIAGGCGLNCSANGRILAEAGFDEIFVPPAPHDAGSALGAAMLAYARRTGKRPTAVHHAAWGPSFDDLSVSRALQRFPDLEAQRMDPEALADRTADAIAEGGVVGWFQGRLEFGPRALGSRSFLGDPRSPDTREAMNQRIKLREPFRPFAPSVKAEAAEDWFELHHESPYMTIIVPVRRDKRDKVPAITHVDGTARPQTVDRELQPLYWRMIDAFERKTGVPMVLNTSFNIQEPIVATPEHALRTFSRSKANALAIGPYWVTHKAAAS